jgi:CRISPR-associated protein Cmr6
MTLPLYQDHRAPKKRGATANAGLWFERFFDQFGHEWQVRDEKKDWLKNHFDRATGDADALEVHALKQQQLVKQLNGQSQVFATQWHFITGMGNPHPVENGIAWHATLGVPYLSGAAVKGIVRNWLEIWAAETDDAQQKAKLTQWFGSESKATENNQAGELIFFDAFPTETVSMNIDIMTPHMGKWYEKGGDIKNAKSEHEKVPADWHDPTPIPYLVVKKANFLFSFAPRNARCKVDKDEVMQALTDALDFIGAGAKTAVGYGQMHPDERATKRLEESQQKQEQATKLQSLTEEQQLIAELAHMFAKDQETGNKAPGNPTNQKLLALIKQATDWSQEDKNQLADLGEQIFGFIGWGKGKKKQERKAMFVKLRGE